MIRTTLGGVLSNHLMEYGTPINISILWGFGSLSGLVLVSQIVTGVFLGMHYCAHVEIAFDSVEHIMRDVSGGWLVRYLHSNGASMFFIVVYLHIGRGLYYGSYMRPRHWLWISGVVILLVMIITAFIGYVLPYGQMSLWGATVITNLVSSVPLVGEEIVKWIWGGYSIENATLNRFYSLHYVLPFIIVGLVGLHLVLLHVNGSGNRVGVDGEKIGFYPYCYVKDLLMLLGMMVGLSYLVYWNPNILGHSDNYIRADKLVTPAHIVPEWYFLTFYAVLRAIPHKLGGVLMMLMAIIVLMLIPFINTTEVRSNAFKPWSRKVYWVWIGVAVLLGWLGQKPVESPYIEVGQIAAFGYFSILLVVMPVVGRVENGMMRGKW